MRRRIATLLAVVVVLGSFVAAPAVDAAPASAITWTVDHRAKTITIRARLRIYSGCGAGSFWGCGGRAAPATDLLARNIKAAIERVWNGQTYRCYKIIVDVEVQVVRDRSRVPADTVGVRVDSGPAFIRSRVAVSNPSNWASSDPSARLDPENQSIHETRWAESDGNGYTTGRDESGQLVRVENNVAAHEFGHVMGLDDTYVDATDPATGQTVSVPRPGAPIDLMNDTTSGRVDPANMARLIGRNRNDLRDASNNPVRLEDLRCDYVVKIEMRMTGARPEFRADIVATGEIELKELARPSGTQGGAPVTHEGRGNLAFVITPQPKRNCTFGFEGSGGFEIGGRLSVTDPFDPETLVLTLAPRLQGLGKDTLIAWPCGGSREIRQPVVPLFTAFYTDRLGMEWRITDWDAPTRARPVVADGWWTGSCALNACRESDIFTLSEAPPP